MKTEGLYDLHYIDKEIITQNTNGIFLLWWQRDTANISENMILCSHKVNCENATFLQYYIFAE